MSTSTATTGGKNKNDDDNKKTNSSKSSLSFMNSSILASKRRARLQSRTANSRTATAANNTMANNKSTTNSEQKIRPPLPPPPPPPIQEEEEEYEIVGNDNKSSSIIPNSSHNIINSAVTKEKTNSNMDKKNNDSLANSNDSMNPITPHRKAKASVIFSEAAAASIHRTSSSNSVNHARKDDDDMIRVETDISNNKDKDDDDDPLKSIHNLLSSIPTIAPSYNKNSSTNDTTTYTPTNKKRNLSNKEGDNLSPAVVGRDDDEEDSEHVWLYRDYAIDPNHKDDGCDATCIPHQSMVMLPNFYNGRTLLTTNNNTNDSSTCYGCGLSHPEECLTLNIVTTNTSTNNSYNITNNSRKILRFGQVITLSCPVTTLALGVRKVTFDSTHNKNDEEKVDESYYYQVGFFHPLCAQLEAEKWTVLPSNIHNHDDSERYLTIGTTAALLPITTTTKNNNSSKMVLRKVSIHDGIVLRNVLTGGLLTLQTQINRKSKEEDVYWTLLTSAYQQPQTHHSSPQNQYNSWRRAQDRVIPSPQDTFCIRPANLPPNTNHTLLYTNRYFFNFQHLQHPNRHDQNHTSNHHSIITLTNDNHDNTNGVPTIDNSITMIQEQLLLDEILGCMMGLEGRYIKATATTNNNNDEDDDSLVSFQLCPTMNNNNNNSDRWDVSLVDLIERIIPLCNQYVHVQKFVTCRLNGYEYGKVAHALCGAMDILLQQYLDFCISLEQQYVTNNTSRMTLLSLWAMIQPSMQTMTVLYKVVQVARGSKGGSLLNSLEDIKQSLYFGNSKAQHILYKLLQQASIPYMQMLYHWLQSGTLADPYAEFMIQENTTKSTTPHSNNYLDDATTSFMDNDQDWDDWYMIREEHVLNVFTSTNKNYNGTKNRSTIRNDESFNFSPHLLHSDEADDIVRKVLTAGKYWNAIALCRKHNHHHSSSSYQEQEQRHLFYRYQQKVQQLPMSKSNYNGFSYWMNEVDMFQHVERAYTLSSQKFFTIVLKEQNLMSTLRFLKQYFLLDQGDFFVHFLDMAENELLQEMTDVSRGRVQNWMNLSIQLCTTTNTHPHNSNLNNSNNMNHIRHESKEQHEHEPEDYYRPPHAVLDIISSSLKCDFATASVVEHLDAIHSNNGGIINSHEDAKTPSRHLYGGSNKGLTGVEALMMDFETMPFPLSLVLSRPTIEKYQLLFRHLFFAKHVERRLFGTWLDHQMIKEFEILRRELGPTYMLRQRMLHFMQNLVYYMMFEVIEPCWLRMESKIMLQTSTSSSTDDFALMSREEGNQTVDDILRTHKDFMRRVLKECLLTNRDLIRTLTKLMTTCLLFSDQMKLFMKTTKIAEEQSAIATLERQRRHQRDHLTKKEIRQIYRRSMEDRKLRKQNQIDRLQHELNTESYKRMIIRFEQVFNSNLSEFMTQLMSDNDGRYHTHLSNLCTRLDFNGFVTKSMNSSVN